MRTNYTLTADQIAELNKFYSKQFCNDFYNMIENYENAS